MTEIIVGGDKFENVVGQMATEGIGSVGDRVADKQTRKKLLEAMYKRMFKSGNGRAGGVRIAESELFDTHHVKPRKYRRPR